jgi:hypothetical protein
MFPGCAPVPQPSSAPPSPSRARTPQPCGTAVPGEYQATVTIAEDATATHGKNAGGVVIVDHLHTDGTGSAAFTVTAEHGLGGTLALHWTRTLAQTAGPQGQPFASSSLAAMVNGGLMLGSPDGFTVSATATFSSGTGEWADAASGYTEPIQIIFDRLTPAGGCVLRSVGRTPGSLLATGATQKLVLTAQPAP